MLVKELYVTAALMTVDKKALNLSYAEHVLFVEYDNMDITTKLLDTLFA